MSGPIFDAEGDLPVLEQVDLTFIFSVELEADRVAIKMAQPMTEEYLGLHNFKFGLTDDGVVPGIVNVYDVTIALGYHEYVEEDIPTPS